MAITPKPNRAPDAVLAFVEKGGTAAKTADDTEPKGKLVQHPLKFPDSDLFEQLERARKSDPVRPSRNSWILRAIAEKLEREGK